MNRLKSLAVALAVAGFVAGLYAWDARRVEAQPADLVAVAGTTDVYAVKFLCGVFPPSDAVGAPEGPVKPGNYATAINIHNPNPRIVNFQKKAVLLFDSNNPPDAFEVPHGPALDEPIKLRLLPDWGLEIDCADIRAVLLGLPPPVPPPPVPSGFLKGWVVIEVPPAPGKGTRLLDVVAVYTAHAFSSEIFGLFGPEGFSLQVLPVTPKKVS